MSRRREEAVWVWTQLGRSTVRVGTLYSLAGGQRLSFRYDPSYLQHPARYAIDPSLPLRSSTSPLPHRGISAAFSDSAPDRWGRELLRRSHGGVVSDLEALLLVNDRLRMGALRYSWPESTVMLEDDPETSVPPLIDLPHLMHLSEQVEDDPAFTELRELAGAGSSLGGARPKTNVRDGEGRLAIAKFSSRKDDWSVIAWEYATHRMAADAGVRTPTSRLLRVGGHPVLLMERFDRTYDAEGTEIRHPYMSAMTALAMRDGQQATYAEIAEIAATRIERHELFRRATFGLAINNTDDHLRNHGFLRRDNKWQLAPAFDMNPSLDLVPHATAVSPLEVDGLASLLSSAELFDMSPREAAAIVTEVLHVTVRWRDYARSAGISSQESDALRAAFENSFSTEVLNSELAPPASAGGATRQI